MHSLRAFLGRDFAYQFSSKTGLLSQLFGVLMGSAMLFYLGKTIGPTIPGLGSVSRYGYFEFALIGVIFARFQAVALGSFSAAVARDQASGTLESILVTATGIPSMVVGASASAFLFTAVQNVAFLIVAAAIFGANLQHANVLSALLVFVLAIFAISPIGIGFAASAIAFRQGASGISAVSALTTVLGGVYFPISVLPLPLKALALVFPLTHALNALRATLLEGAGVRAVSGDVIVLGVMAVIGLPVSIALFRSAIVHALKIGSLTYY
jgi:ABC-2 type transport system permease protein